MVLLMVVMHSLLTVECLTGHGPICWIIVGLNRAKDLYLNLQLGQESQKLNSYLLQAGGQGFPGTLALKYLASASTPTTAYVLPSGTSTTSYFSSANINYKDRYVISGSFRRDGSSVFGANHKWGNFYSVGASWNINEEAFLQNSNIISLLKLRTSYGENGNAFRLWILCFFSYLFGYDPTTMAILAAVQTT